MEFHEKLQFLRKKKKLTQEELASALFVSRTAVSKWESGRGYPNIESLKDIAKLFSVSVDELLSGDELLTLAEECNMEDKSRLRNTVFGLLDLSSLLFFFLPFFGQRRGNLIQEVSLLKLTDVAPYAIIAFWLIVASMILLGAVTLILQNCQQSMWRKCKNRLSIGLNLLGTLLFVIGNQVYAAVVLFVFLIIKLMILIRK